MLRYLSFFVVVLSIAASQSLVSSPDSVFVPSTVNLGIKAIHDPWFSGDKLLHFSASAAACGLTYHFYVNRLNRTEERGKVYAISLTALFGIGKEIYDKKKKGYFSWKDLFWDGFGLAVGYFVFVHEY